MMNNKENHEIKSIEKYTQENGQIRKNQIEKYIKKLKRVKYLDQ